MGDLSDASPAGDIPVQPRSDTITATQSTPQQTISTHAPSVPSEDFHQQRAFPSQGDIASTQHQSGIQNAFHMGMMRSSLPQPHEYNPSQIPPGFSQQYDPSSQAALMQQQMQQMQQYGGQSPTQPYYVPNHQMPQYFSNDQMASSHGPPNVMIQPGMSYFSNQMSMGPQSPTYYAAPQHGGHMNMPNNRGQYSQTSSSHWQQPQRGQSQRQPQPSARPALVTVKSHSSSRGPPRKPKQSGFAIWIGNLPPATKLIDLVDHVCVETVGVQSLFLISKSNCAFANYKEEQESLDAQQKLHDSKFQNVRLVCRIRKVNESEKAAADASKPDDTDNTPLSEPASPVVGHSKPPLEQIAAAPNNKDRFFILKSLNLEDLERSVTTGIWATQSHNEKALAEAFETAENVYLIFSANKSGEYFGYARMASQINQDPNATIEFAPQNQTPAESDQPKPVPVEATERRPAGQIIDDADRGTAFWEALRDDAEAEGDDDDVLSTKADDTDETIQTRGKPFHLVWLSSSRLPFYRTRGLRNPWNSNREVKIARDGTELEPTVGKKLIGLFNRNHNQGYSAQMSQGSVHGFTHMTQYGR